jgi:hypothetical protein
MLPNKDNTEINTVKKSFIIGKFMAKNKLQFALMFVF